jgi:hypothetical protein
MQNYHISAKSPLMLSINLLETATCDAKILERDHRSEALKQTHLPENCKSCFLLSVCMRNITETSTSLTPQATSYYSIGLGYYETLNKCAYQM